MIKFLIIRCVKWLTDLSKGDFLLIVAQVAARENDAIPGSTKAAHVGEWISKKWDLLPGWVVNLLRELALAWVRKQ